MVIIFVISITINQLEIYISNNNLLRKAICCCLQTCNVVISKKMVSETCVTNLIVIDNTIINQKRLMYH